MCNFTRAATVMKKKSGKLFVLGILRLFHFHVTSSLRHRRILTSVSNVCEEALMSLFWAPKDSTYYRKSVSNFLSSCLANRHWHGAYSNLSTQVRPRTRISALFCRRTWPAVSFVCGAGYVSRGLREDYKKHFPRRKKIVIVWFSYFDASNAVKKDQYSSVP